MTSDEHSCFSGDAQTATLKSSDQNSVLGQIEISKFHVDVIFTTQTYNYKTISLNCDINGFNLTEVSSLLFAPSLLDMKLPSCPQLCCGIILSCLNTHPCMSCLTFRKLEIIAL